MVHLVISGTGRAGTTFLVQWLDRCGVDCGDLSTLTYNDGARAGLERKLTGDPELPYVVKDPWLWTYLDDVDPAWVDVLVMPVRDLDAAARSRVDVERTAIRAEYPDWDAPVHAWTPGGVLNTVTVTRQSEILAVGFHHLIQWAVHHDVPLVLVDFPRIVTDEIYADDMMGRILDRMRAASVFDVGDTREAWVAIADYPKGGASG